MPDAPLVSHEYKNEYLYIIVRQAPEHGPRAWLFCCGVSIRRFDVFCRGTHGICSNPAFRGLQLLRADAAAYAIAKGMRLSRTGYGACMLMAPKGDGWYRESLLVDDASSKEAKALRDFAVRDLLTKVLTVAAPGAVIPTKLPNPPRLQAWIDGLDTKN